MHTYPSHLEGEVKFATQNAKLSRIRQGNISLLDAQPRSNWPAEGRKGNGLIKNWSSVLAKEARQENLTRLEDLSEQPAHFGEVEIYTRCQALHSFHRKAVENGRREASQPQRPLGNHCAVGGSLTPHKPSEAIHHLQYQNWWIGPRRSWRAGLLSVVQGTRPAPQGWHSGGMWPSFLDIWRLCSKTFKSDIRAYVQYPYTDTAPTTTNICFKYVMHFMYSKS